MPVVLVINPVEALGLVCNVLHMRADLGDGRGLRMIEEVAR
jgi:hypothetical protein